MNPDSGGHAHKIYETIVYNIGCTFTTMQHFRVEIRALSRSRVFSPRSCRSDWLMTPKRSGGSRKHRIFRLLSRAQTRSWHCSLSLQTGPGPESLMMSSDVLIRAHETSPRWQMPLTPPRPQVLVRTSRSEPTLDAQCERTPDLSAMRPRNYDAQDESP